jgi:hypothetical protein
MSISLLNDPAFFQCAGITPLDDPVQFCTEGTPRVRVSMSGAEGQISAHVIGGVGIFAALPGAEGTLSAQAYLVPDARISLPGAEGVVSAMVAPYEQVSVSLLGPEGRIRGLALNDWTAAVSTDTQTYYACDLVADGYPTLRVPISSWQATLQEGRSSYLQIVIPAATVYIDAIRDMSISGGEMLVYRGARFPFSPDQELLMARAPMQTVRFDIGPTNSTCTIQGYTRDFGGQSIGARTLRNLRSISIGSGYRVRADIDWWLRPGDTAQSGDFDFVAAYINYYVNVQDQYMDVGERAA